MIGPRRWRAVAAVAGVVVLLLGLGVGSGPARAAAPGSAGSGTPGAAPYRAPVEGPPVVVRGFDDVGRYDPGHRGVDLRDTGPVLAAAPGVVTFAGPVAGRGVVTVQHADGIRTSYEPVAPAVVAGAVVAAGAVLGTVSGAHGAFPVGTVLHWGARLGERYLDPLTLLAALGPVRLLPWDDP